MLGWLANELNVTNNILT